MIALLFSCYHLRPLTVRLCMSSPGDGATSILLSSSLEMRAERVCILIFSCSIVNIYTFLAVNFVKERCSGDDFVKKKV